MSVNLYKLLKQNAPGLFQDIARKKILKLESEIKKLREKYKTEKDEGKREEIKLNGLTLKKELEEIKSLLNENEISTHNN